MLPTSPQFRDSVSAVRVQLTADIETDDRSILVCDRRLLRKTNGGFDDDSTNVVLQQGHDVSHSLREVLKCIADELFALKHPYTSRQSDLRESIASKILGISVLSSTNKQSPLESINLWLSRMSIARVAQWVVFDSSYRNVSGAAQIGDFTYAPIDMSMLESRCRRAGSTFFEEHGITFQGRLSICRDSRKITVLEIGPELPRASGGTAANTTLRRIIDSYFSEVALAEQSQFVADLESQQAVYGAAGILTFRSDTLTHTEGLTDWISIFTRDEKAHGWVTGGRTIKQIPLPYPQDLNAALQRMEHNLGLNDWQQRPLDQSIQSFSHYFNAARDHYTHRRTEEAVLHLVFALEMLLGGLFYDSSSRDVVERVACLVCISTKRAFDEIVDFVRSCYKVRNKYVHGGGKGTAIDDRINADLKDNFSQLAEWASIVLGVALFARQQVWCQGTDAYGSWLNRIESVRRKCVSRIEPDADEVACLGLNRIDITGGFVTHLKSVSLVP